MNKVVRAKSPVRLGLGGGGTDVSPYCDDFGGVVLNLTINRYAYATLRIRDDQQVILESKDLGEKQIFESIEKVKVDGKLDLLKSVVCRLGHNCSMGFELTTECHVPPRSGLGSSGAMFMATIGVFNHLEEEKRLSKYQMAELAYQIERVDLGNIGGRQDQLATVFGGINFIDFFANDISRVEPLQLHHHVREGLPESLVLFHIGERGDSGSVIEDQKKNVSSSGDAVEAMHQAKKLTLEMRQALFAHDINLFGELLHQSWEVKKRFSSKISNSFIDEVYEVARKNYAIGGKISGAGGGGHMFFVVETGRKYDLVKALSFLGVTYVPFEIDWQGMRTWESYDYIRFGR